MMTRREFVEHIALLAAGAAALPQQIAAFTNYYEINAAKSATGLVAIDEIYIGGMATCSVPMTFDFFTRESDASSTFLLKLAMNTFGSVVRWVAAPDQKIVVPAGNFHWQATGVEPLLADVSGERMDRQFAGYISYIQQDGLRVATPLGKAHGHLPAFA